MKISGRTFVISGGASGLGRATALELAQHGGNISILDLNEDAGAELVKQLGGESRAKFFPVDVTDTESIAAAVEGTAQWVSKTGAPLGGIIPAAGVGNPGLILDGKHRPLSLQSIDFVLNINLRGTLDVLRQFLPLLAQSPASPTAHGDPERGVVVMVASAAAFDGQMGQTAYAASKGAVASMTLPLTRDLSRFGIRVLTIAPGTFETPMTAMMSDKVRTSLEKSMEFPKRGGTGEEFAALVRSCVENVMLNGTVIRLDGGARMPSRL
ncbi:NAD(P)-binding protein [Cryphonectria parasitica EP155]|uniref:NAD(P)-binding protein n=1 Tax=Cryphonectria parasitica (strain ATCC 38755 / EP155) TaxID=660469 RepID=A0A9P5CMD4_CRYP1|nr:NAD(P)-binding protein [Cryphonectria parasitica EP155]KAF3764254.1 NAD(P)-binding protein [Cryphonectria parasitica EP155]